MLRKLNTQTIALLGFYLAILIIFSVLSPTFRTVNNFKNLLMGFSHIGILAVGETFPILLGGIDLSVGAIMGLVGMTAFDLLLMFHLPGWLVIIICLLVGAAAGLINGFLVVKVKLNPFIATLATFASYRGLTYAISGRQLYREMNLMAIQDPVYLGIDGLIDPIPYAFIYLIIVALITWLLLHRTKLGVEIFAAGGNENAARLAGVNTGRVKMISYIISGTCSGIAALILTARMTTSTEDLGITFELSAIAAAVIGGVSMQGGVGGTIGPCLGAFIIGTIYIGMTILGVTTYAQPIVAGVILMGAVGYDRYLKIRRDRQYLRQKEISAG